MITSADCRESKNLRLWGESTDEKPTENVGNNSRFIELDTGKTWYFNGTTWKEVGWNKGN